VVVHAYHPTFTRNVNRKIVVQADLGINSRPYSKITKVKMSEGVAQMIAHLPSKHKALTSNSSTAPPHQENNFTQ
jgi:hypothetical protein